MDIQNINMTLRLQIILARHGVKNIEDVAQFSIEDINKWEGLNKRLLGELLSILGKTGCELKSKERQNEQT